MFYQAVFMLVQWRIFLRREYLYYITYILANTAFFIFRLDKSLQFLPLHLTGVADEYLDQPLVIFAFLMYIRFGSYFLQLRETQQRVYIAAKRLELFFIGFIILKCILIPIHLPKLVSAYFYLAAVLLLTILALPVIIRLLRQKNLLNNFLVMGALCITVGGVMGPIVALFLPNMGDGKVIVHLGLEIGILLELLLLNTGLVIKGKLAQQRIINSQEYLIKQMQQTNMLKEKLDGLQEKLSSDLHDDVGASLSSIQLYVEVIEKVIDKNTLRAKELLAQVKTNARDVIGNMGDIVWALNNGKAYNTSFEDRLKNHCYELLAPKDISCFVEIPDWFHTRVSNISVLRNLMMVTKEGLNNIAKYSQASHCEVQAILTDTQLMIRITDDGIGFDTTKINNGNGLRNMRQRIEAIGGQLMIDSIKEEGTTIGIMVPLPHLSQGS